MRSQGKTLTYLFAKNISSFSWFYRVQGLSFLFIVLLLFLLASFGVRLKVYLRKALGTRLNGDDSDEEMKMRSTKEDAYHLCTVHEVVTVLHGMRFHGLDAILDWPGTFCLDLMCSVFLTRELVSVL